MPDLHIRDLVTERIPLFDGAVDKSLSHFCDLAVAYLDQMEKAPDREEICLIRKAAPKPPESIDEDERSVVRLVSTAHRDRDNEILLPSGVVLDQYRKNPVVLYGHSYGDLPIGRDLWVKVEKGEGIKAKTQFASAEANPLAEQVFRLIQEGILNTSSVGFIPLEWEYMKDGPSWEKLAAKLESDWGVDREESAKADRIYTRWILLEHSDVAVPSNPNAINLAVSKSIVVPDSPLWKDMQEFIIVDDEPEPEQKDHEEPLAEPETPETKDVDPIQRQLDELRINLAEIAGLLRDLGAEVKAMQEKQADDAPDATESDNDPDTLELADEPEPEPEPDEKSAQLDGGELTVADIKTVIQEFIKENNAAQKAEFNNEIARVTGKVWQR